MRQSIACALLALCLTAAGAGAAEAVAPLNGAGAPGAIPGQYIVVMKAGASTAATQRATTAARTRGATILKQYRSALQGYAAVLAPGALAAVRQDPDVDYVEADGPTVDYTTTQINPPWGLDRIDQRNPPLDRRYSYRFALGQWGFGVMGYVIDSGIRFDHAELGGRAGNAYNAIDPTKFADDCNGHGTHVAGIFGATTYGVDKQINLFAVKVTHAVKPDGTCDAQPGLVSNIIAGVNWVTGSHLSAGLPAVANLSVGARNPSTALDQAVRNSIANGVFYAIAGGNDFGASACARSPQRVGTALTVGATDSRDWVASYSNQGPCIDVFAPGSGVTSTWATSPTATQTRDGTSMAAPHAAGLAALFLDVHPDATPAEIEQWIVDKATPNVITGLDKSTYNRLLFTSPGIGK